MKDSAVGAMSTRGISGAMIFVFGLLGLTIVSMPALGQSCGVANWSQSTGVDDGFTGVQGPDNRRYGGPCGLRVPLDGEARFLTDHSPLNESQISARFYAFFDDVGTSDPVWVYSADDGSEDRIEVWYNVPSAGDLTLTVRDAAGGLNNLSFFDIPTGWHSIEYVWSAGEAAEIRFALSSDDPDEDLVETLDTSGLGIVNASLGNLNGASGGTFDFDDYASRRSGRPGRLKVADADDDTLINVADIIAIADEVDELGFAPGQPDCNEDGSIDSLDAACIIDILDNQ